MYERLSWGYVKRCVSVFFEIHIEWNDSSGIKKMEEFSFALLFYTILTEEMIRTYSYTIKIKLQFIRLIRMCVSLLNASIVR